MYAIRELPTMRFPNATVVALQRGKSAISFALNSSGFVMSKTNPTVQINPGEMN